MYDARALRNRMLGEIESAINRNMSLPGYWYGDPDVSRFELDYVIRRAWQPAGPISRLTKPGDFLTTTVAGVPVVLLRDQEGTLRGFLNMCRHRGHPVATDHGNCKVFVCAYHGWSYRQDGSLLRAPRSEKEDAFDAGANSLVPIRVGAWGELGFVNLHYDGPTFEDRFATLMRVAEDNEIGISKMTHRKTLAWEQSCNWKTFMDNTADCYHCRLVHPTMGTTHKTDPDDYVNESYDTFAFHISHARQNQANLPSWMACGAWPNWTLQGMQGAVSNVRVLEVLDANHIRVRTEFFAPATTPEREVNDAADWYYNLVYGEDRPVCEGVARNIIGGRFEEGPVFLSSEKVVQDFQRKYRDHLLNLRL
jgi:choline monooxygenase